MTDQEPPDEYGLMTPFVTCVTNGGPHDDTAYVAGYEMGSLDKELSMSAHLGVAVPIDYRLIHATNRPQADLIAMKHNYVAEFGDVDDFPDWLAITIHRPDEHPNPEGHQHD